MKSTWRLWLLLTPCVSWLMGCLDPVDAPSAFENERFLCDEANAAEFDARVERCRAERVANPEACFGVLSFKGQIDGEAVVVDAPVTGVLYTDTPDSAGVIRTIDFTAKAPYFLFRLDMRLRLDPSTGRLEAPTLEDATYDLVNIEARGANYFSNLVRTTRNIEQQADDEARVAFASELSRGGAIQACFHVFPRSAR